MDNNNNQDDHFPSHNNLQQQETMNFEQSELLAWWKIYSLLLRDADNFDTETGTIFEKKLAPWDPPITTKFNFPFRGSLNNLVSLNSMLFLKGLPVKNNFEPIGAIVGQKPHATALAFLEKNLFTRPKTAFPSCKTTLKLKIFAARIVGNVGYPPNPTTTQGL